MPIKNAILMPEELKGMAKGEIPWTDLAALFLNYPRYFF
jgi:hypothetical protein